MEAAGVRRIVVDLTIVEGEAKVCSDLLEHQRTKEVSNNMSFEKIRAELDYCMGVAPTARNSVGDIRYIRLSLPSKPKYKTQ